MVLSILAVATTALRCGPSPGVRRSPLRRRAVFMMEEVECDVVIVGGGPAGCTCALYTARADHKTVLLDKNPSVGALAITSTIASCPGVKNDMSGEAQGSCLQGASGTCARNEPFGRGHGEQPSQHGLHGVFWSAKGYFSQT